MCPVVGPHIYSTRLNDAPGTPSHSSLDTDLYAGVYSTIGPRDSMEDRNIIAHNLCSSPDLHLMAVFDGHRGAEAAEYAQCHLTSVLEACCLTADSPTAALKQAFIQLEAGWFRGLGQLSIFLCITNA